MTVVKAALGRINNEHVPIKTISKHSKPYWNANLSLLSSEVRKTRKRYKYRSNEFNKRTLDQAKLRFSDALNTAQSNFIEHHSSNLNGYKSNQFWNNFKKTFYNNHKSPIGNLKSEKGVILTEDRDKANALYESLFLGQHLDINTLDKNWYHQIMEGKSNIDKPSQVSSVFSIELSSKITKEELDCAIKSTDQNKSNADPDGFHPKLIKSSKPLFRILLLHIFNLVMKTGEWPWKTGTVIFLPKPGKDTMTKEHIDQLL
jgi:hypothetical protein